MNNKVNLLETDFTQLTAEQEDLSGMIEDIKSKYGEQELQIMRNILGRR